MICKTSGDQRRENVDAHPLGSLNMNQEFSPRRPGLEPGPIRRGSSARAPAFDTFLTITAAAYGSLRSQGRREMEPRKRRPSHDSLRLLRSLTCSSASSCAIDSKCSSRPSLWCRASLASSAAVSAIRAAASSGPPSPAGSSVRDCRSLREAVRFRPPPVLVKKPASEFTYMAANTPIPPATLGRISQLFGYESVISEPLFNICRFDRGPLNTHVRPETVACESRRANLRFFP